MILTKKKIIIIIIHAEYSLVWFDKPPMCLKIRKLTQLTKFSVTKKNHTLREVYYTKLYIFIYFCNNIIDDSNINT